MTTLKQARWELAKTENRQEQQQKRGKVTRVEVRQKTPCTCQHAMKHHKATGRCRRGCDCQAGVR